MSVAVGSGGSACQRKIVGGNSAVVAVERWAVEYRVRYLSRRANWEGILLAVPGMGKVPYREEVAVVVDFPRNFSPVGSSEVYSSVVLRSSSGAFETMDLRRRSSAVE